MFLCLNGETRPLDTCRPMQKGNFGAGCKQCKHAGNRKGSIQKHSKHNPCTCCPADYVREHNTCRPRPDALCQCDFHAKETQRVVDKVCCPATGTTGTKCFMSAVGSCSAPAASALQSFASSSSAALSLPANATRHVTFIAFIHILNKIRALCFDRMMLSYSHCASCMKNCLELCRLMCRQSDALKQPQDFGAKLRMLLVLTTGSASKLPQLSSWSGAGIICLLDKPSAGCIALTCRR